MRKTKQQLEQEIAALKQELEAVKSHVKMWQDAHAAALKALAAEIRQPGPAWFAPHTYYVPHFTAPLTSPYELPKWDIICSGKGNADYLTGTVTLASSTIIPGVTFGIGEVKVSS